MELHSKAKGTIGELAVAQDLIRQNYAVFTELGDLSKVDLIALKGSKVLRLQIKSVFEKEGTASIGLGSSGPNYKYYYTAEDVDVMVLYVIDLDEIIYVPIQLFGERKHMTFRLDDRPRQRKSSTANEAKKFSTLDEAMKHLGS